MQILDSEHGRIKILTSYKLTGDMSKDKMIIPYILDEAMPLHKKNVTKMDNFINIYYNNMDIQNKTKVARPDINNKISFSNAQKAVETINAYCFAKNPKCISQELNKQDSIKKLNDNLNLDDSWNKLREIAFWDGICGLGYRYVRIASPEEKQNGLYFKSVGNLDPRTCFCVYSNNIERDKIIGVIYYDSYKIKTVNNKIIKTKIVLYNVFTKWHHWIFEKEKNKYDAIPYVYQSTKNNETSLYAKPLFIKNINGENVDEVRTIPLIEYTRNYARLNDFELTISIMNAINTLVSNAVDASVQNVDYVFKMKNIDMGTFENGKNEVLENTKRWLAEHIIAIKGIEGATIQPDMDILEVPLNLADAISFVNSLKLELKDKLFLPSREGGTGQDTGVAVENRNGFRELEDIAGIVTNTMLTSEKEYIKVVIEIINDIDKDILNKLTIKDIKIESMRNKMINVSETFNTVATGLKAGIPPEIVFERANFTPDFIECGKDYEKYRLQLIKEGTSEAVALEDALAKVRQKYTIADDPAV